MKNIIFLDSGVLGLYLVKDESLMKELSLTIKRNISYLSSELNFIELYNHICREKGKISSQIIMENLRRGTFMKFIPVTNKTSIFAGELKCKYRFLSIVDSVVCAEVLLRKADIYTTETHFSKIKNLKVKKFGF